VQREQVLLRHTLDHHEPHARAGGVDPFRWTVLGIKEEGVPNAKKSSTVCT
jgi:hypothetical protein